MFLEDKHADLKLETGESREIWWITDKPGRRSSGEEFTIMSDCPGNYPRTALHTMSFEVGIPEYQKLISEGWSAEWRSSAFMGLEKAYGKGE